MTLAVQLNILSIITLTCFLQLILPVFGSGDILQLKDTIESPLHHVR